jgi:hypothetical protein
MTHSTTPKSFGFLEWLTGNCIDVTWTRYWAEVKLNYGFAMFLTLFLFLILRFIFRKRRQQ